MTAMERTAEALQRRGFAVSCFEKAEEAAQATAVSIPGQTAVLGDNVTLE